MAHTTFFNLFKPAKTDKQKVSELNNNFDIIDTEMHRPPLTVNNNAPDGNRNIQINSVPLADNLTADDAQLVTGTFIERSSGGSASISDGSASLSSVKGNMVKTGYIAESIQMTVNAAEREAGVSPITATIDRDTFVSYVGSSGTISLNYTTAWSANPATYGITVTGTPINGDNITVVYVKEDRGTLTAANPTAFVSTGWNLYDNTTGRAKVVKYSDDYGYAIGGTYSLLEFATTISGARSSVSVSNGRFSIPSDGYVFVTGGNSTTCIYMTWSDWYDGYDGEFQSYVAYTIDLTEIMLNFPYGLLAVGSVRDEINLNTMRAINRVQRLAYTAENLAVVIASGVAYDTDTNYIYAVLESPVSTVITGDSIYTVSDHGIEYFSGTSVPVVAENLYGQNLKDKLRRDVLTISAQTLTSTQKEQVLSNIGAASSETVTALDAFVNGLLTATVDHTVSNANLNNYKTGGTYYFTTGCSNVPSTYFMCLVVNHGTDFCLQIGVRASAPTILYYRTFATNSWTDWQNISVMFAFKEYTVSLGNISASSNVSKSETITVNGYVPYSIRSFEVSDDHLIPYCVTMNSTTLYVKVKNYDTSSVSNATITVRVAYVKSPANVTQLT